ncbi:NAD-dependent epimerase/dehydratase family protein [Flammeovirgaceae bacterium SG7u.111]|nr:NAD-dependent epimerase/dehydratase family protein [Flammeovirgaceae bacterium SG7u.132]WPO35110.1 NAD-dependent epimerase/dehydratase family protein [Flammeovirgaceae bacterium SG7u.111]
MAKVLITGTAGFIGSHLAHKLADLGHEVVGLDAINEYYDVNLKYGRLERQGIEVKNIVDGELIKGSGNISFIKLALEESKEKMYELFESEKFDYVINLAAQAGVRYSLQVPEAYVDSNVSGFLNILEACRKYPVKHLLYASSSSVYGLNTEAQFKESHPTEHPVSIYAATKKANEMMAHSYSHLFGIPTTGLRFFTVYGPWGRPDMALFIFTKKILADEPIDVYNYGKMQRDFTYIDDIVNGIANLMPVAPQRKDIKELPSDTSSAPFDIYNIGNSNPVNLMDFVKGIEKALGKKAKINLMPIQPGDVPATSAAMDKMKEKIHYMPDTSIEEGTAKFIEWYLENYHKK